MALRTSSAIGRQGLRRNLDETAVLYQRRDMRPDEGYRGTLRRDARGFFVGDGEPRRVENGNVIGLYVGEHGLVIRYYNVFL